MNGTSTMATSLWNRHVSLIKVVQNPNWDRADSVVFTFRNPFDVVVFGRVLFKGKQKTVIRRYRDMNKIRFGRLDKEQNTFEFIKTKHEPNVEDTVAKYECFNNTGHYTSIMKSVTGGGYITDPHDVDKDKIHIFPSAKEVSGIKFDDYYNAVMRLWEEEKEKAAPQGFMCGNPVEASPGEVTVTVKGPDSLGFKIEFSQPVVRYDYLYNEEWPTYMSFQRIYISNYCTKQLRSGNNQATEATIEFLGERDMRGKHLRADKVSIGGMSNENTLPFIYYCMDQAQSNRRSFPLNDYFTMAPAAAQGFMCGNPVKATPGEVTVTVTQVGLNPPGILQVRFSKTIVEVTLVNGTSYFHNLIDEGALIEKKWQPRQVYSYSIEGIQKTENFLEYCRGRLGNEKELTFHLSEYFTNAPAAAQCCCMCGDPVGSESANKVPDGFIRSHIPPNEVPNSSQMFAGAGAMYW